MQMALQSIQTRFISVFVGDAFIAFGALPLQQIALNADVRMCFAHSIMRKRTGKPPGWKVIKRIS